MKGKHRRATFVREKLARQSSVAGLLALFAAYCVFVFVPIIGKLGSGAAFGGDVSEYLLAAHEGVVGGSGVMHYVFPVMPFLYTPVDLLPLTYATTYVIADIVSGILMVGLFVASGLLGFSIGRTRFAAGAGAVSVGTFALLLGEVGWGGQAQLLAFMLGSLGIATLLWHDVQLPRISSRCWAGIFLAAAVLAEAYAAIYFVAFALIALLFLDGRHALQPRTLVGYVPVVGLPLVAAGTILANGGLGLTGALHATILSYALHVSAWQKGISETGFGSPINVYAYTALLAALVAFAVIGRGFTRRTASVLLASLGALWIEVVLLTPAVYWDRAPYFFAFPLLVTVSVMAPELSSILTPGPESKSPPQSVKAWSSPARRRRWVRVACGLTVLVVLVAQSGTAAALYPPALQFYSVDAHAIGELTWLRSASGAALMVAPEGQTFPIAYATERPLFPAVQPVWFDTTPEQATAMTALTVVSGSTWITDGAVTVVDSGAVGNGASPSLFIDQYPYFVDLLNVAESQGSVPAVAIRGPSTAGGIEAVLANGSVFPSGVSFSDESSLPNYAVSTVTSVQTNGTVVVNLRFNASGPSNPAIDLALGPSEAMVDSMVSTARQIRVVQSFGEPGSVTERFSTVGTITVDPGVSASAPIIGGSGNRTFTQWVITPAISVQEFNLSISLRTGSPPTNAPAIVSEKTELAADQLQWIIVESADEPNAVARFMGDSTFALWWTSPTYDVFSVR